jgi:hypothetical protein
LSRARSITPAGAQIGHEKLSRHLGSFITKGCLPGFAVPLLPATSSPLVRPRQFPYLLLAPVDNFSESLSRDRSRSLALLHIISLIKQEVGGQLLVLVAQHVCLQHHLSVEAERFELGSAGAK